MIEANKRNQILNYNNKEEERKIVKITKNYILFNRKRKYT